MTTLQENYTLSNGVKVPKIGLGTWLIDDDKVAEAVKAAIKLGYRHIDTAQAYQNERGVGEGIRESGVKREELFVTTKLAAEVKSYEEAVKSIDESIKTLGIDYIDMMIIHSPKPWQEFKSDKPYFEENKAIWKALEEAYKAGKLKAIGLSNFEIEDVQNILDGCEIKPMVNQTLVHAGNRPAELIDFCEKNGLLVEAYSPIGHGELMKNEEVKAIAEKYDVSVPQLGVRYDLQLGLLPLPKTANPDHMKSNAAVDFVISDEDMDTLNGIKIKDYGEASKFPVFAN